eukprot:CAMPEP_0119401302 /NCGR_PEP_ID=MMETSP1334-20130426/142299_1 /TAXON_ID=127549 /ORGANISM="Calcidiscus leptoporus, Strain RCC1130" /LENGTH=586 /DNA_ID=CAMNT_0007425217 /DNA_START=27 /DNA_END=1787 /DNA_ORIENTATION=-
MVNFVMQALVVLLGLAPARAQLSPQTARQRIIDWIGPAGKYMGGCRTGTPGISAHVGRFDEVWAIPESECRKRCGGSPTCVAYEWVKLPQGYSRCEMHKEEVTHVVPAQNRFLLEARAPTRTVSLMMHLAWALVVLGLALTHAQLSKSSQTAARGKARNERIIDWDGPAGKYMGGCRTGKPGVSAQVGRFDEVWAIPETECRKRCGDSPTCLAYEWVKLPQGYSRCEMHKDEVTHVVPVDGSFCFTKRVRHSGGVAQSGRPNWAMSPPARLPEPPAPPPPPPHPCASMLQPNKIVAATPECADLMGVDLRGMNLAGTTFDTIDMTGALLNTANLAGATFRMAALDQANFTGAQLEGAKFAGPLSLSGAEFTEATMKQSKLTDLLGMTNAKFIAANMDKAVLRETGESMGAIFDAAILTGASITGAIFMGGSSFRGTNFMKANMELFECDGCVFSAATKFGGIKGRELDFANCQMDGVDLSGLKFNIASFEAASLVDANFAGTRFLHSSFYGAKLTRANFAAADLPLTEFNLADVTQASFVGATLTESSFVEATIDKADFTGAIGLETVEFVGNTGKAKGIPPSPPI